MGRFPTKQMKKVIRKETRKQLIEKIETFLVDKTAFDCYKSNYRIGCWHCFLLAHSSHWDVSYFESGSVKSSGVLISGTMLSVLCGSVNVQDKEVVSQFHTGDSYQFSSDAVTVSNLEPQTKILVVSIQECNGREKEQKTRE